MFIDLVAAGAELWEQAAIVLFEVFRERNVSAWPTLDHARKEIGECANKDFICIGSVDHGVLAGWAGLRPMYDTTWELHPMVVRSDRQNTGIGRRLLQAVEDKARARGIVGIVLGTDDENGDTSLSGKDLGNRTLFREIENIRNLNRHPYEFYLKSGYIIIGAVPDSGGPGRPDIWMWKRIV